MNNKEIKNRKIDMGINDNIGDAFLGSENIVDFSKIRVGAKTLEDATIDLNVYKAVNPRLGDKEEILRAINNRDYETMRDISNFFYRISGIYSRLCRYMAYLYRYDWFLTPYINSNSIKKETILDGFNKTLNYLDNFGIKEYLGETALKVVKNGCYYGYIISQEDKVSIQELPPKYCRSRFKIGNNPVVEFNMKFFDEMFIDTEQRMKILNLFPKEFKKGYIKYREGRIKPDFIGDDVGWYMLDPKFTIKFNINEEDFPAFISVIPAIIDLNEAQRLDKKKMEQQLLKIIVQSIPLNKDGDPIFDMDEVKELHNNAVHMLGRAIGIDVLTTFAKVDIENMSDKNTTTTTDDLEKVERGIYNEAGVSQMQFNTDGNIALEKSILNDEASMYNLLTQFERFLNKLLESFNKNPKKIFYKIQLLTTTIYNYKEISKIYKEQTQLGYSKMLPQVALGQSQSSILANAYFENDILDLVHVFIPPLSSSTMSAEAISKNLSNNSDNKVGRAEKPDDEKSEKTIQNKESMN